MTRLSVNKTKCTVLLAIAGPVLLLNFDFSMLILGLKSYLDFQSGLQGALESTLFLAWTPSYFVGLNYPLLEDLN